MPEKEENVTVNPDTETTTETTETTEPKTFTQEDLDKQVTEDEKAYKGLQREMAKKDKEIQELGERTSRVDELERQLNEFRMYGELAKGMEGLDEAEKTKLQTQARQVTQNFYKQEAFKRQDEQYRKQAKALVDVIADAGLNPDDKMFARARAFGKIGDFEAAEIEVSEVIDKNKPKGEEVPKETDAEKEERITRKVMDKENLLKSPGGSPSGASRSFKDKQAAYAAGEISTEEFRKAREEQGI